MIEETAAGLKAEALEIVDLADVAISKAKELHELEEARRQGAIGFLLNAGVPQMRKDLHNAYADLHTAYEDRTAAKQSIRDAKDAFAVAEANAIVLVKTSGDLVEKDPATGKSNKAWIDGQVATMIEALPDYQKAKKALHSAENRVYQADMNLDLATKRLSVARTEAFLVAGMLGVQGGNNG